MNMNNTVLYNLPVQTEIPEVISVPRAEMCSNALLFYDAFRGLCRMRIKYAQFMAEGFAQMNINEKCRSLRKKTLPPTNSDCSEE